VEDGQAQLARPPGSVARGTACLRVRGCRPAACRDRRATAPQVAAKSRPGVRRVPCRPRPGSGGHRVQVNTLPAYLRDPARPDRPQAGRLARRRRALEAGQLSQPERDTKCQAPLDARHCGFT